MQQLYPPSIVNRIIVGKLVGAAIGLSGFVLIPAFWPDVDMALRIGVFLWYATLGSIIGVFGVFDHHPIFGFPFRWYVRAPIVGAWMNLLLTFFAWDLMEDLMGQLLGRSAFWSSPLWFVVEGALVGLAIGWAATHFGGEGKKVVDEL